MPLEWTNADGGEQVPHALHPAGRRPRRIARVIDAGRRYAVVPWQMALVARAMKLLPNALYDRLFKRAGRKPRGLKL